MKVTSIKNLFLGLLQLHLYEGDFQKINPGVYTTWIYIKVTHKKIQFLGSYNLIYIKVTPHVYHADSTVLSPEQCLEGPPLTS